MAEPTGVDTGTNADYASMMPPLSNTADVQKAIQYYHYGNPDNAGLAPESFPTGKSGGLARRLKDINDSIGVINAGAVFKTTILSKGDLIVGTAASTTSRLAPGTAGQILKVNSATASGLEWYNPDTTHLPLTGGTVTGAVTLSNAILDITGTNTEPAIRINAPVDTNAVLSFRTGTSTRWTVYKESTAESGSNVGSNFIIRRFNDGGTSLGVAATIDRSTGLTTLTSLTVSGVTNLASASASSTVSASTAPTLGEHLTNKTYVDAQVATSLPLVGGTLTGAVMGTDITLSGSLSVGGTLGVTGIATFSNTVITKASNSTSASLRLLPGTAPSSPVNGDVWMDSTRIYGRSGGVTKSYATTSDKLSVFAQTTHSEFASILAPGSATGTGAVAFMNNPVFGTPTLVSGIFTGTINATGASMSANTPAWSDNSALVATTAYVYSRLFGTRMIKGSFYAVSDPLYPWVTFNITSFGLTAAVLYSLYATITVTCGDNTGGMSFGQTFSVVSVYDSGGQTYVSCTSAFNSAAYRGNVTIVF